ncbi:phosphoribosylanthranilate isomerase [Paenibacillus lemnae]|uniref:N-(5'-phosphoribosyl)anthranilate isomerase n=1 Tax=Paenibacillus lemnae TaxID=1330551 RepID=A0A848M9V2_PAELE|nr:phosphoribosylanthranilate isomerase [Paenibacillus lemnae]NMO96981.1 phosphoribosylanthranilate isomerase [Paenibacillus lemnae]
MSETLVKICGLQSVEVLKSMINLPVDYVGLMFANSKRQVNANQAAELIRILKHWNHEVKPASVGVFVNPELGDLEEVMDIAPLDVIQLHGQESPQFCREVKDRFPVSVFKVSSIVSGAVKQEHLTELDAYVGSIDALLLDTYDPVYGGGSGKTFDWESIPVYQEWSRRNAIPLFVAGGLTPSNLRQLIETYHPDGVDVSSGVESSPGVKDIDKVTAFVERVKNS